MITTRKTCFLRETINTDRFSRPCEPITRIAAFAVFENPLAGHFEANLSDLFVIGGMLGKALAPQLAAEFDKPPVSYGKAAIVGVNGDMEHGGAIIHPKIGAPMREAIGGGEAVIPSNVKLGGPGTSIDLPLGHKDDPWSFDHFDTMTLAIADAPLPNELVMILAYADGPRPNPRCGKGPVQS